MLTNPGAPSLNASEDHHLAFFLSILPDFQKLKRTHKRDFKIRVMTLLNDCLKKDEEAVDSDCKLRKLPFIHFLQFTIFGHRS